MKLVWLLWVYLQLVVLLQVVNGNSTLLVLFALPATPLQISLTGPVVEWMKVLTSLHCPSGVYKGSFMVLLQLNAATLWSVRCFVLNFSHALLSFSWHWERPRRIPLITRSVVTENILPVMFWKKINKYKQSNKQRETNRDEERPLCWCQWDEKCPPWCQWDEE